MKILAEIIRLDPGGVKTSLINFLNNMCDKNEVDLLVLDGFSNSNHEISEKVNILPKPKHQFKVVEKVRVVSKKAILKKIFYAFEKVIVRAKKYFNVAFSGKNNKQYDVAICYCGLYTDAKYVLSKTKAKMKCMIYHGDVQNVPFNKRQERIFSKFDKLFFVSKSCAEIAKQVYPKFATKIDYLHNFQSNEDVLKKASEINVDFNKKDFNIVTAARIGVEKGQLRMLEVMKKLHDENFDFVWHLVGDGPYEELVKKFIAENKMEKYIILHGYQSNPYPYIKAADLFLLCSHHEAAPMVFGEAMLLKTPVLSTRTRSADELVGEKGYVCENNEEGLYEALKHILENKDELKAKTKALNSYTYDNEKIKQHFYDVVNGEK